MYNTMFHQEDVLDRMGSSLRRDKICRNGREQRYNPRHQAIQLAYWYHYWLSGIVLFVIFRTYHQTFSIRSLVYTIAIIAFLRKNVLNVFMKYKTDESRHFAAEWPSSLGGRSRQTSCLLQSRRYWHQIHFWFSSHQIPSCYCNLVRKYVWFV